MNEHPIAVFDFETGGDLAEVNGKLDASRVVPIQVACLVLDPRTLEVIPGSEFESMMRPPPGTKLNQKALDVNKKTAEQVWAAPADWEAVWKAFAAHLKRFSPKHRPIPCGKNIDRFDLPIADWLSRRFGMVDKGGGQTLFNDRVTLDLEHYLWQWFEDSTDIPSRGRNGVHKMDDVRPYFGLTAEGAHDALVDVRQTAELVQRFQRLVRNLFAKVRLRGACAPA